MKNHFKFACRIGLAVFLLCQFGGIARGESPPTSGGDTDPASVQIADVDEFVESDVPEETAPPLAAKGAHLVSEAHAGYCFYNRDGNVGRAAEYEYLHSNPMVSGLLDYLELDNKFALEGNFLNDRDYYGDLSYDHKGLYRLQLRTESLFHNLDHESLFSPNPFTTASGVLYQADDRNPGASYGVRVEQDLARFRYKLANYPLHLNLEYWRMTKEGSMQQRYADQAFEGSPNTIFAQSRRIDRQTHEGNIVFDTHLGLVDLIYDFKIREFGDYEATPSSSFEPRTDSDLLIRHNGGVLPHDETPDSRFYSHTIKLHTSLSGGIVGAASYTFAKRENRSSLSDIQRANRTADTMHNVAGDFTYTPCGFFSMALKYRRQEVDRDAPGTLTTTNPAYITTTFNVRPAIDTVRDTVTATLSFLPIRFLTIKGEYKGEFLSRDNLDGWNRPGIIASTILPDDVNVHKGTLTLLSRPLKGLRLKAQYSYSTADHAMYGNGSEQRHEGSFLATYNAPGSWGVTANTRIIRESSDHLTISTLDRPLTPSVTYHLPRERELDNATFSLWFVPFRDLTVSGSYGLLRNNADQGVLFAGTQDGSVAPTNYTSQAQVYSLSGLYRFSDKLDLSLVLQQVRSFSKFTPEVSDSSLGSEVQRISRTETRENSLSARGEYQFTKNISCLLDYSYRDYDDKSDGSLSGTLHTVSAFVRAKW